ncbi:MAG: cytidine deaminase [Opitutaceae bacterium]|jgi:cytidine deaminase|nr:cytidine deaminase [Opitutaceae bacterium]
MKTAAPKLPLRKLAAAARNAARNARAPYSGFRVGAAVLDDTGRVHAGCNVENASLGLTICAERAAVFAAVTAGAKTIRCVLIHTPTPTPTAPCGACRQVLREFSANTRVIALCDGPGRLDTTLDRLLPDSFGPDNLAA